MISYHDGDQFANSYSAARISYYGITGFPTSKFDGILTKVGGSSSSSMYSTFVPYVNQRNNVMCDYTVEIYGTKTGSTYNITLIYTHVAGTPLSNLVSHFVITESGFPVSWGIASEANFVCRQMVPSANGTPVDFSSSSVVEVNLTFNWNSSWSLPNVEFVSFLQNTTNREVMQGGKVKALFLQPPPPPIAAGFTSDVTEVCEASQVEFTDQSQGNPTSWFWEFEGGTPETSTEQNPVVTYNTAGVFDVTLTVSKGDEDSTTVREDYITVYTYPVQPTITQVEQDLVSSAEEGNQWFLEGDSIPGATNQVYTPTETGYYTVTVTENGCISESEEFYFSMIGIDEFAEEEGLRVFPSPNHGQFTVHLNTGNHELLNMKLYSSTKSLVYSEENIQASGMLEKNMDFGNLPNGIYFLIIEGKETFVEKVIIQK